MTDNPNLWEVRRLPDGLALELWGGANPAVVLTLSICGRECATDLWQKCATHLRQRCATCLRLRCATPSGGETPFNQDSILQDELGRSLGSIAPPVLVAGGLEL